MSENLYEVPKEILSAESYQSYITIGKDKKLIEIVSDNRIKYVAQNKNYNFQRPEEKVRASFYVELVEKYKYSPKRINLEVIVPRRKPEDKADIVVYEDDELKKPYIVVECKKDGISKSEINQAIEQAFGNANSLRAKYAILVSGNVRIAFDVAGFKPSEREKNIIADIPIRYGKLIRYKYKKGDSNWDLRETDKNEILAKFQQCHDILWEGGKRNPAEAFDEMSKLMFCKIHDERFITKIGEYYRFQIGTHENIREVADRVKKIYRETQGREPGVFTEPIKAEDPLIYSVVEILQGVSLSKTDLDAKGVAFEHFLGKVFRGEMGQYFTPRTIVEFMVEMLDPDERQTVIDPACGSGGFLLYTLERVKRDVEKKLASRDAEAAWRNFALDGLFGIEINSQLARVAMMNMIIHEDGHSNIENNDALDDPTNFLPRRDIKLGKYTMLMTNPPFGAVVKDREKDYLRKYELGGKIKLRKRQKTEILFLERCLDFLRPGGKMGIVIPDGILTNSSLQYVRDFITERAQILAVVSLPQTAFIHYGAGVKASLLFLRKKQEEESLPEDYPIFMAIAEHIGYDATGRPDKNEFPEIFEAYRKFLKGERSNFPEAPLCFVVEWGELEGRFDPFYYKPEFIELIKMLSKGKYQLQELCDIIKYITDGSHYTPKYEEDGIPVLSAKNIFEDRVDFSDINYISEEEHKRLLNCSPQKDDILVTKSGTIGRSIVVREDIPTFNSLESIARFRVLDSINPHYISAFLNSRLGQKEIYRLSKGVGVPHLQLEKIKLIKVPIPPHEIQDTIAQKMDEAYGIKKEKEAEGERLLNSIDDYVLGELGITLPELKDEKYFVISFRQIKGKRLDPYYHQPKFERLENILKQSKHGVEVLSRLLTKVVSGQRPAGGVRQSEGPILSLGGEHIDNNGDIYLKEPRFISKEFHNAHRTSEIEPEDILIVKDGATTGKVAFVDKNSQVVGHNINEHIFKLGPNKSMVFPYYLFILIYTRIGQLQIQRNITGSTQMGIIRDIFNSILIPVPSLPIQEKIAQEVKSRRERAKRLKQEAKEIVRKAKEEVERMILGEGGRKG